MRFNINHFGQVGQLGLITLVFCIVLLTAPPPLQRSTCPVYLIMSNTNTATSAPLATATKPKPLTIASLKAHEIKEDPHIAKPGEGGGITVAKQNCRDVLTKYLHEHGGNPKDNAISRRLLELVSSDDLDDQSREELTQVFINEAPSELDDQDEDTFLNIVNARDLIVKTITKPAELIKGILYQGGKMSYNAPSKMGKTWSLLHLGISISEGIDWFGFQTMKARVLFINPELQNFSFEDRIQHLARNLSGCATLENFDYVSTRGRQLSSNLLLPLLEKKIMAGQYGAIILDSIYKLYPHNTEANSSSDIGRFLGGLEKLANHTGAAIIYSHHYSKGNQASKGACDCRGVCRCSRQSRILSSDVSTGSPYVKMSKVRINVRIEIPQ